MKKAGSTGGTTLSLTDKIIVLHQHLEQKGLPHAFGGALALAWCTGQARGTIDIDVNVFVASHRFETVLEALPEGVEQKKTAIRQLAKEGQARLWWGPVPVDIFLDTTAFHEAVAQRVIREKFVGEEIPFLACQDLAVFKAFFNRTKDWADLEAMVAAGTIDTTELTGVLAEYLGAYDERIGKVRALGA